MALATKNGSLIVKNGSVAENCNCCASGWYCFDGASDNACYCICDDKTKTIPNILLFNCVCPTWSTHWNPGDDRLTWPTPDTGGPIALVRQTGGDYYGETGCNALSWYGAYGGGITVTVLANYVLTNTGNDVGSGAGIRWFGPGGLSQSYANNIITSTGRFSSANGYTWKEDMCNGVVESTTPYSILTFTLQRGD